MTSYTDGERFEMYECWPQDPVCECELDWRCWRHAGLPTPEDLIATWWSEDHP